MHMHRVLGTCFASCPPSLNFSLQLAVEAHISLAQSDLNGHMRNTLHTISGGNILSQVIKEYAPVILYQSKFLPMAEKTYST